MAKIAHGRCGPVCGAPVDIAVDIPRAICWPSRRSGVDEGNTPKRPTAAAMQQLAGPGSSRMVRLNSSLRVLWVRVCSSPKPFLPPAFSLNPLFLLSRKILRKRHPQHPQNTVSESYHWL
jgi:hypothetical protein